MKKISITTLVAIFLSLTLILSANAGRGGRGRASNHSHCDTTVIKEVVFEVPPEKMQEAVIIFQKKYPEYKCGEWEYNYDGQTYQNLCSDNNKNQGKIRLTMDGYIKVTLLQWAEYYGKQETIVLGEWL